MGCYVNPPDMSKEDWLKKEGIQISEKDVRDWDYSNLDAFPVCLVDNGAFKAAGVAFDSNERFEFLEDGIGRKKDWFLVETKDLKLVSPLSIYRKDV